MKKLVVALLAMLPAFAWAGKYHVGEIGPDAILENQMFAKFLGDITFEPQVIEQLNAMPDNISIKVFFGQWCHDSQRELPRIIELSSQLDAEKFNFWYYALNTQKSDPKGLAKAHKIRRTPTMIIYRDGEEVGRILEFPRKNWPADIIRKLNK